MAGWHNEKWRRQMAMAVARDCVNLVGSLGYIPLVYLDKESKKLLMDMPELDKYDKKLAELHGLNLKATLKAVEKGDS